MRLHISGIITAYSSRFIADPNLAYKSIFSSFIRLSHSSAPSESFVISELTRSKSVSSRFSALESFMWTNVSPIRYLRIETLMCMHSRIGSHSYMIGSSSSANSSSMDKSSSISFSCWKSFERTRTLDCMTARHEPSAHLTAPLRFCSEC